MNENVFHQPDPEPHFAVREKKNQVISNAWIFIWTNIQLRYL